MRCREREIEELIVQLAVVMHYKGYGAIFGDDISVIFMAGITALPERNPVEAV